MRRTFYVPRRFHPAYSLLGRWLQRRVGDVRQAEAFFLIILALLLLALLLAQYVAWVLLKPAILAAPTGTVALAFWGVQAGTFTGGLLACAVGFRPAVSVTVTASGLCLEQGRRMLTLALEEVEATTPISALRFHRHYARYAATHVFANRVTPELLLLETAQGPVVVGLLPDDHAALQHFLDARLTLTSPLPTTRVA